MSLLGEYKLIIDDKEIVCKLTNRALYIAQNEMGCKGILELVAGLDSLDLPTIYNLLAASSQGKVTVDELLDADIDFVGVTTFLAESIAALFDSKKLKPAQRKAKKAKK